MLKIESTVKSVRGRMETFAGRIASAQAKVTEPKPWLPVAVAKAKEALEQVAQSEFERELIDGFVKGVATSAFGAGAMTWSLTQVIQAVDVLGAVGREQFKNLPLFQDAATGRPEVEQLILDWVAGYKDKSEQEFAWGDREIADRIINILFGPRTEGRVRATASLIFGNGGGRHPTLGEFALTQGQNKTGLDADTMELWLNAVLVAWRELLLDRLPEQLRKEIHNLWNTTQLTLSI